MTVAESYTDPSQSRAYRHFVACLYDAIFHLLRHLHRLVEEAAPIDEVFARFPFLGEYMAEMQSLMPEDLTWTEAAQWWSRHVDTVAENRVLPLEELARQPALVTPPGPARPELGPLVRRLFVLAGLVEEDSRFGAVFSELQAPLPHRRPTLELLAQVVTAGPADERPLAAARWLLDHGFLACDDTESPFSELRPSPPRPLWTIARGEAIPALAGVHAARRDAAPTIEDLLLDSDTLDRVNRLVPLLTRGRIEIVVVRGRPGSERDSVVEALAAATGRGTLSLPAQDPESEPWLPLLGPASTLTASMPVLRWEAAPGERVSLPSLAGYRGPIGVVMGLEGGLAEGFSERAVSLSLPRSSPELREAAWRRTLPEAADPAVLARSFVLETGFIARAGAIAEAEASLAGGRKVGVAEIRRATRTLNHQLLDSLADRLVTGHGWGQLVCGTDTRAKLSELELRCRHRERLLDVLGPGFATGSNCGVRALLTGPSGTGKTLAAKVLAGCLGLDLYRVDLAAIVNKYIGETEKNLDKVLSRAEALDLVLLLDEGDSLLGGRTEVRNANDRYANLETNFLLQRLEHYNGILVVTTNLGANIDSAFQRRMDVVVPFALPEAQERRQILELHLPADHVVAVPFLDRVAVACQLSGGQLRNVAMLASLLALDGGDGPVAERHLEAAVRSEYRKAG
ncbi:MAG: ATP-binding protein, partial [Thermoanaerobaculia bacterium]|nr:ATP-binding protein [Thermoanaerobaculia bacterium]